MGKNSKRKAPVVIKPEYVLKPGSEPPKKKKKKNAPDRPQPEWMFPPDEENPVLNPKPKSEAQRKKDEEARDQAIKFLQYKSVSAPLKAPPPDLLLTLVGAFLSSYGFNSTSRIYTTQLQSRKKLDAWKTQLDAKLPKGFPDLVKIYKEWYKIYEERTQMDQTSSSDSNDSSDTKEAKKLKKAKREAKAGTKAKEEAVAVPNVKDETSSSGGSDTSSEGSDFDVEMKDGTPALKNKKATKAAKAKATASSSSHSSSDSDADDEEETAGAKLPTPAAMNKPTVQKSVKSLKRKASSNEISGSSSESESVANSPRSKRTKAQDKIASTKINSGHAPPESTVDSSSSGTSSSETKPAKETPVAKETTSDSSSEASSSDSAAAKAATADSSSSESASSDDESSEVDFSKPPKPTPTMKKLASSPKAKHTPSNPSSDSSETLQATSAQKPSTANTSLSTSAATSSSDSVMNPPPKRKRSPSPSIPTSSKHQKKQNTPFQRVPKDTPVDPKLASNAYQSYDYADKAYQDLSVTKGKGFTKEKNKKKRGSYRGGPIDVSGGKGIKFNDD